MLLWKCSLCLEDFTSGHKAWRNSLTTWTGVSFQKCLQKVPPCQQTRDELWFVTALVVTIEMAMCCEQAHSYTRSVQKESSIWSFNMNGLHDINVNRKPRSVDWNAQWQLHYTSQWYLIEHVHCVAIAFKIIEWLKQQIFITFSIRLEHSSTETIRLIQKLFGDEAMHAAQMKVWHRCQRWSRNCWKWSIRWQVSNK